MGRESYEDLILLTFCSPILPHISGVANYFLYMKYTNVIHRSVYYKYIIIITQNFIL